jgi:hypothetical protein
MAFYSPPQALTARQDIKFADISARPFLCSAQRLPQRLKPWHGVVVIALEVPSLPTTEPSTTPLSMTTESATAKMPPARYQKAHITAAAGLKIFFIVLFELLVLLLSEQRPELLLLF